MTESQTITSVQIDEPVTSTVSKHTYKIILKGSGGLPVAGEEVTISMVGSGGFAVNFHSDEIKRTTDQAGEAEFAWYRRGIFTRGVKATVSASVGKPDCTLELERVAETPSEFTVSYVERPIKLPPRRV